MSVSSNIPKILARTAARRHRFHPGKEIRELLREGASDESIDAVGKALGTRILPELRELYSFADGQNSNATSGLFMVPQNLPVNFLALREMQALTLHWRAESAHPVRGKFWKEAGFNPAWLPIGFNESKHVALCVSTQAGRITRFATPDAQVSHATEPLKHLNEKLEEYLRDVDAYISGARQPFSGLGSWIESPGISI